MQLTRILRCRTSRSCNRERQLSFPTTGQRNRRSGDESLGDSMKHLWSPARGLHTDGRRANGQKVENAHVHNTRARATMTMAIPICTTTARATMIGDIMLRAALLSPGGTHLRSRKAARSFSARRLTAGNCMVTQKERIKPARRWRFSRDYPNHYADDVCRYRAICFYCRMIIIVAINFNFRIPTRWTCKSKRRNDDAGLEIWQKSDGRLEKQFLSEIVSVKINSKFM